MITEQSNSLAGLTKLAEDAIDDRLLANKDITDCRLDLINEEQLIAEITNTFTSQLIASGAYGKNQGERDTNLASVLAGSNTYLASKAKINSLNHAIGMLEAKANADYQRYRLIIALIGAQNG